MSERTDGVTGSAPRSAAPDSKTVKHWREMLTAERSAADLYERIAAAETGERAEILRELAAVERKHAAHWEAQLADAGVAIPSAGSSTLRTRLLGLTARWVSPTAVLKVIERAEQQDAGSYDIDPDAAPGMADDERGHARALAALGSGDAAATASGPASGWPTPQQAISGREGWHRGDRSGAVRAGIFGISDGLVSNTALVMGFAGSGSSRHTVLLAGVAGLLAGSFSMAAGEYVSMSGQREMFERELSLEASELRDKPEEELEELVLLYRAKGLSKDQAREVAEKIMSDHDVALNTLAREELGLDPDALGSPWRAAGASLLAFAVGAVLVVLPYLIGSGTAALVAAVIVAGVAMLAIGAGMGLLNGRSMLRSGMRQLIVGGLAAAVTYVVGALIGGVTG